MRRIENLKVSLVMFFSSLFKSKAKSKDLKEMEFSSSTQKMGISFTDKIRNVFRHKWIKKS
jgi:hypothetical protein